MAQGGKVAFVRVGVTGLASKPYRAHHVEQALTGLAGEPADLRLAAAVVANGIDANSDLHGSAAYRSHLARVYTTRALAAALARTA